MNGIKSFKSSCKKWNINYRKNELQWVIKFSKILSKYNAAYTFWHNARKQGGFNNIIYCLTYYDLLYGSPLFTWSSTVEGHDYWCGLLAKSIFEECIGCIVNPYYHETDEKMKKYILSDM